MLILDQIAKSFYGQALPVLRGVSLTLPKGELCVLIGSNGSGKSTLLKCISGEYTDYSGKITLSELPLNTHGRVSRSRWIASVAQDVVKGTVSEMTLLENLVLGLLRGQKSTFRFYKHYERLVSQTLQEVGLERHLHQPMNSLSGGQRQTVATLMAICSQPSVLLLDEHTSALDPPTQQMLMEHTVKKVKSFGITTLMITHQLDNALRYGDRIIMMHKGQLVLDLAGADKAKTSLEKLLAQFHLFEDSTLHSQGSRND